MAELSTATRDNARKIEATILQRLASIGQARVADSIGISESTVSRWKDGDIARLALTLAVLGLKAVPVDAHVMRPEKIAAVLALARDGLDALVADSSTLGTDQ